MKSIKRKLGSKRGASMLMAMVFLLFCLMIGGSVLAAASANGSRAARKLAEEQDYLSQRSATLLLADMLKGPEDTAMQLTVKNVKRKEHTTVSFMAHGSSADTELQKLLHKIAIEDYLVANNIRPGEDCTVNYPAFVGTLSSTPGKTGTITLALTSDSTVTGSLTARYDATDPNEFIIDYAVETAAATESTSAEYQTSYLSLSMKCYIAQGSPVVIDGVSTTTTVIRWEDPVIQKGGA